ncbi:MAG: hypothetical protein NWQ95_04105 [Verrucomicrobiales bacterium]|nr:hypothetical protein [Verrucomicrobiales bacterium]
MPRLHESRAEAIALPFAVKTLGAAARLLGVADITALFDETAELRHRHFRAPDRKAIFDPHQTRRLPFKGLAICSRRSASLNAGRPGFFFERAAHEKLTGSELDEFEGNASAEIDELGFQGLT